ncbi:MAG: hypothetical protein WC333_06680 [Dehalococcoidia bacterium]
MGTSIVGYVFAGIGGAAAGAVATHYIEKLLFNRGLKKMQAVWKHEARVQSLQPVRDYLDKLSLLVGAAEQQAILARTSKKGNAELNQLIIDKYRQVEAAEPGTDFSVGDSSLVELLRNLRLDNKEHVIYMSPNLWFSPTFKDRVREAYKRLEYLSTQIE